MKYPLAALGGIVCGFLLGELVAVALGLTAEFAFGEPLPLALKPVPLHLAVAGAAIGPYVLGRRPTEPTTQATTRTTTDPGGHR